MKNKTVTPRVSPPQEKGAAGSRIGDTSDLPDTLVKQLRGRRRHDLEQKIEHTLRERYKGAASVDEIMVGLYRDFKYVPKSRAGLATKLYQMAQSGALTRGPNQRGVFALPKNLSPTKVVLVGRKT